MWKIKKRSYELKYSFKIKTLWYKRNFGLICRMDRYLIIWNKNCDLQK
jgi:hypothetical protein